jgi:TonB family protein
MNQDGPLADFDRGRRKSGARKSSRAIAAGLTTCLYALMALFALLPQPMAAVTVLSETTVMLVPDMPSKTDLPTPPPVPVRLLRPHVESIAPPDFTVATVTPPSPAPLPAIAPLSTPMLGGTPSGTGALASSGNGTVGTGGAVSGCFDAAWARAVRDRIGEFYRYPSSAMGAHGVVMMQFTVHASGRLEMEKVATSSGNKWLDRAAYDMVHEAQPLPHVPPRMHAMRVLAEMAIGFGAAGVSFPGSPDTCE